ncbi:sulfatase family protein [Natrinema longum]|uniref:Sulfatase n=2 Tax=Natrinema longum TaxID=370324 RepID=A0A8A2U6T1_9EURY|nr:sulfatase [Natrinema longum]QSW84112.1 sulfatase [Natrinema longum]
MIDNVIVVVLDALRADRVKSDDGRDLTPYLDELASDSVFFSQAYSTTTATDPAVTSLQTGRHPLSHGVRNHGTHVTSEEKAAVEAVEAAPEVFKRNGFATSKIGRPLGRWHKRGFDEYPNVSSTHWHRRAFEKRMSKLLYNVHPSIGDTISGVYNKIFESGETDYAEPEEAADEIVETLEDDDRAYSFVHWMDTHTPYSAPKGYVEECLDRYEYGDSRSLEAVASEYPEESITANSLRSGGVVYEGSEPWIETESDPETGLIDARYDAAVRYSDAKLGALVSELRSRGLYDSTMIVALSDHGESLGEHGIYYEHHGLYECTVRIPLLLHVPGQQPTEINQLVSIMDVLPTMYDYAGIDDAPPTDGQSLRPVIEDGESVDRTEILAGEANAQRRRAILTDNWKYIRALDDGTCRYCDRQHAAREELYNLEEDPEENRNVIEENRDIATDLSARMEDRVEELTQNRSESDGEITYDDEEEMMDRLEALGYR